jgi:hypothetical protein
LQQEIHQFHTSQIQIGEVMGSVLSLKNWSSVDQRRAINRFSFAYKPNSNHAF